MAWQPVDEVTYMTKYSAPLPPWQETFSTPGYYQPPPPRNNMASIALACSIAGVFTMGVLAIPGIILGHIAARKTPANRHIARGAYGFGYTLVGGWIGLFMLMVLWSNTRVFF